VGYDGRGEKGDGRGEKGERRVREGSWCAAVAHLVEVGVGAEDMGEGPGLLGEVEFGEGGLAVGGAAEKGRGGG
jgi:hypothetical protein